MTLRLCLLGAMALFPGSASDVRITAERRLAFNDEWRFHKGEAAGAEAPGFRDTDWRPVQLPHDWAIEGPFDAAYAISASNSMARCPTRKCG